MKATLVVVGGEVKATAIRLKLPVVIGRSRQATLTVPHPLVSRKHCELFEDHGRLMVRDLGSLNGTYIGSQRVDAEAELPDGELLTVATVNFRAVYGDVDVPCAGALDDVGEGDSAQGSVRLAPEDLRRQADDTADVPAARQATDPRHASVERDTQWQMGALPHGQEAEEPADLGSLFDDAQRFPPDS